MCGLVAIHLFLVDGTAPRRSNSNTNSSSYYSTIIRKFHPDSAGFEHFRSDGKEKHSQVSPVSRNASSSSCGKQRWDHLELSKIANLYGKYTIMYVKHPFTT